mmetsp:Transcript_33240/g.81606  ORF Transcript_33240/g.81606 Transcript_33240/m.81606 type:complete len:215 (+) Transcript_33240:356-1000(+)
MRAEGFHNGLHVLRLPQESPNLLIRPVALSFFFFDVQLPEGIRKHVNHPASHIPLPHPRRIAKVPHDILLPCAPGAHEVCARDEHLHVPCHHDIACTVPLADEAPDRLTVRWSKKQLLPHALAPPLALLLVVPAGGVADPRGLLGGSGGGCQAHALPGPLAMPRATGHILGRGCPGTPLITGMTTPIEGGHSLHVSSRPPDLLWHEHGRLHRQV